MHRRSMVWLLAVSTLVVSGQTSATASENEGRGLGTRPRSEVHGPVRIDPLPERLDPKVEAGSNAPVNEEIGGEIAREARRAARWTAGQLVDRRGRIEYYRVGFHAALRAALNDPTLGRWDLAQGERDGWRDPQAHENGHELGEADAARAAALQAERQVAAQFRDLSRMPRFRALPEPPDYHPEPPRLEPVTLRQVLAEIAFKDSVYLSGWDYDAWRVYRCDDFEEFYAASWNDADRAFSFWAGNRRRAAVFERLADDETRARFRAIFRAELQRSLARRFGTELRSAYRLGFEQGWSHGAFAREEWSYRRGFRKGFRQASSAAAVAAFDRSYARFHEASYRDAFRDWSDNPKPEIGWVVIHDDTDDGIFEPGERVLVEYELINYGGRSGRFGLALSGGALALPGRASVDLPGRDVVRERNRLTARISELTPRRTRTSLSFTMAGLVQPVELLVSRPLELSGASMRTRRDNLNGEVTVEIAVRNMSRRLRGGTVELRSTALPGRAVRRELEVVGPAESTVVNFGLSGLEPLSLISGTVALELELQSEGVLQDRFVHRLAGTASDLQSRDLLELLVRMSRDGRTSPPELAAARELLMQRLRADWSAAVRARGNPYKKDLKTRGRRTALGDLVQTYRLERNGFMQPEVFGGLSSEILLLARELPGAHPLLRKQVRRLARQLP